MDIALAVLLVITLINLMAALVGFADGWVRLLIALVEFVNRIIDLINSW